MRFVLPLKLVDRIFDIDRFDRFSPGPRSTRCQEIFNHVIFTIFLLWWNRKATFKNIGVQNFKILNIGLPNLRNFSNLFNGKFQIKAAKPFVLVQLAGQNWANHTWSTHMVLDYNFLGIQNTKNLVREKKLNNKKIQIVTKLYIL